MDTSVTRAYWQDPINFERMLSIFVHLSWLLVLMNMGTVMPKFTATRIWGLCWVPATRLSFTKQAATRHFRMKTPTGLPTLMLLQQGEGHFYGVQYGELFFKWFAEGDPEYAAKLCFNWVEELPQPIWSRSGTCPQKVHMPLVSRYFTRT
ncbi:hypothetical protein GQ600_8182 [Phytophthora cactorum]|nr:hypothetical protein GQ600_8182 [Phytophthora cactorum]